MATITRRRIGPADHGRRMTLDEFLEADFEEGWLYELARGAVVVTEVPGVNLSKLSPVQVAAFKKQLSKQQCDCGCGLNALQCRLNDRACGVSRKLAREQLDKFLKTKV